MLKNSTGIPLSVAVWLATDSYDYVQDPNYISATSLLKPLKSIILSRTIQITDETDIADLVPSKMGTAVHDQIERAWMENYHTALSNLGYQKHLINSIIGNPEVGGDLNGKSPGDMDKRTQ